MTNDLDPRLTGRLALADGSIIRGRGFGAAGTRTGELCFNTAMTGYQEILTDPSYAGQIVTFTRRRLGPLRLWRRAPSARKPRDRRGRRHGEGQGESQAA
jgi:Carbamoylphosphate synthase small subunit